MLTLTQFFHMNQGATLKETLNNTDLRDSSHEDINQALISAPIHHHHLSAFLSNMAVHV